MKVQANAKINLSLCVGAKENGFHALDGLVTSVNCFDLVEVNLRSDDSVVVHCSGVPSHLNTATVAARRLSQVFHCGFTVDITKNIPFSGGMGGSSADAAALLYCAAKLLGHNPSSQLFTSVAASVGSDVNFMLQGGFARMQGKGDDLTFYSQPCRLYFVVACFDAQISAAQAYSAFDELSSKGLAPSFPSVSDGLELIQSGNLSSFKPFNALQSAVQSVNCYADSFLRFAADNGLSFCMTGSGACYFSIFTSLQQAEGVANLLNSLGFRCFVCNSVPCGIVPVAD